MAVKACRTPHACVALLMRAAQRVKENSAREDDPQMRRMYAHDYRDMVSVAGYISAGKKKMAYEKAQRMDTAAREEIPMAVWCWMDPTSVIRGCR